MSRHQPLEPTISRCFLTCIYFSMAPLVTACLVTSYVDNARYVAVFRPKAAHHARVVGRMSTVE
jgi:hypothetical protein